MTATLTRDEIDAILNDVRRPASAENRRWDRELFNGPVVLSALDAETGLPTGEPIVAEGRDFSSGGIRFVHNAPIPAVRMMAVVRDSRGEIHKLLVAHVRTIDLDDGQWESATRFVQPQTTLQLKR